MKLLIATPLYPPDIGGPATYAHTLAQEFPRHDVEVEVLSFGDVRHLPKGVSHAVFLWKCFQRARQADAVYALDLVSVGLPACIGAKIARKPLFLKVVGDYAWEQYMQQGGADFVAPEHFSKTQGGIMTRLRALIQTRVARSARMVVVPSEYLKNIVRGWGIEPAHIRVIYNAFHAPAVKEDKKEIRALLGVEGTVLCTAGRLVPWKGVKALVDIMPAVAEEFSDAVLLVAGDGPDRELIEEHADALGVAERVRMIGSLPRETLHRYIRASDVFVLNTGYEGFSHQLLEVMALGTPIVTTDAGGNPELIESGKEGLLVSYNNKAELSSAILEMLRKHVDTKYIVANAKTKVTQFSTEKMITETLDLFSHI